MPVPTRITRKMRKLAKSSSINLSRRLFTESRGQLNKYLNKYVENEAKISSGLADFDGVKTDLYAFEKSPELLSKLKFSIVFSDLTSVFPVAGTGLFIKEPKRRPAIHIPEPIRKVLVKDGLAGTVSAYYVLAADKEVESFVTSLSSLIDTGLIIVRPCSAIIIWGKVPKRSPFQIRVVLTGGDQLLREQLYSSEQNELFAQMIPADPSQPSGHFVQLQLFEQYRSLPIKPGKVDQINEQNLFDIAVPFIGGIPLSDFSKIVIDEQDILRALRSAIKKALEEAPQNKVRGHEIVNDVIRPEIDRVERKFKSITRIHRLRVGGACLCSAVLSLASLTAAGWAAIAAKLIGAGGLGLITKEYADYLESKDSLRENPFYLFWRLSKIAKKD